MIGMKKEWFTARELTNIGELRKSEQGINKRARRENWQRRRRKGRQGTAYEYHINSLPPITRRLLQPAAAEEAAVYVVQHPDPAMSLRSYFACMTQQECDIVLHFLAENGIVGLLELISSKNE